LLGEIDAPKERSEELWKAPSTILHTTVLQRYYGHSSHNIGNETLQGILALCSIALALEHSSNFCPSRRRAEIAVAADKLGLDETSPPVMGWSALFIENFNIIKFLKEISVKKEMSHTL